MLMRQTGSAPRMGATRFRRSPSTAPRGVRPCAGYAIRCSKSPCSSNSRLLHRRFAFLSTRHFNTRAEPIVETPESLGPFLSSPPGSTILILHDTVVCRKSRCTKWSRLLSIPSTSIRDVATLWRRPQPAERSPAKPAKPSQALSVRSPVGHRLVLPLRRPGMSRANDRHIGDNRDG